MTDTLSDAEIEAMRRAAETPEAADRGGAERAAHDLTAAFVADPLIDWTKHSTWYSAPEIAEFQAAGGVDAALARLRPELPANAAPFEVPKPLLKRAATE